MQRSMAMANIGAEKINEFAELTCMRNNDTNTAGVVEQAATEEVETDKKNDGTEA